MTPLTIIFALLAIAAVGAWGLIRRNRAKKLVEQRASAESERLANETRLAQEKVMAEAKARDDVRQQTEAEERSRREVEAKENARLADERRVAAEKLKAESDAKRWAEEKTLADAQLREAARLKAEVEATQRAEAEVREKVAEEEQRAEERRQAEEQARVEAEAKLRADAEAREKDRLTAEEAEHARAEAEAREKAQIAASQETRRKADEKVHEEKAADGPFIEPPSQPPEKTETSRPPTYRPTAPSATTAPSRTRVQTGSRTAQTSNADLRLRVQLVFGRGGDVRSLALAPDRRDGMPGEIEVTGTQGELHLTDLRDDCYDPVALADAGNALTQGIEWRGRGDARRWRWVLGGRELYVLAPGDEFGLHGFVSTARLWLNARHVVLAAKRLREQVLTALAEAGCATPEVSDDTTPGVPTGWLLFREVIPTRFVQRDERDILNALCPAHDIQRHFVGGIKLERNTWLAGYPPRIRFTGEFANGFQVKIDDHPAQPANDGAFEAPGWDSEGEHRLWFGDQAETYSLRTMHEAWEHWPAHDFGTGAAICGAGTSQLDATRRKQIRVPVSNLLLIGARPGEIFHCHSRSDVRCETVLAMVSFMPVWALPLYPAHADKESARILLFHPSEPLADIQMPAENRAATHKLCVWISAIREAGCKGLALAPGDEQTKALWRRYRVMAKKLRRAMR
jgi:hypothetical protein